MTEKKFTSSPWGFRFWEFEEYCRFMKKIGIDDICVMFGDPARFPLACGVGQAAAADYRSRADDCGVRMIEAALVSDYKKEMSCCDNLGVKYLRICDCWEDTEEKLKSVIRTLQETGKIAGDHGKTLIVENHGGLMTKAATCRRLFEEVGLDNVRLNYDPANFLYFGENPIAALDEIMPYIGFTHFKGLRHIDGQPEYCRLKDGDIGYGKIFEKLLPAYSGYIGLEYENSENPDDGTVDDLAYIKNLLGSFS